MYFIQQEIYTLSLLTSKERNNMEEYKDFCNEDIFDKLRPCILDLIHYYYDELGNCTGGNLHIVLDDGNIEHHNIFWCQELCKKEGDEIGYLIGTILRTFPENELEEMWESGWNEFFNN